MYADDAKILNSVSGCPPN